MKTNNSNANSVSNVSSDLYDFSGPLWKKYYVETREKVRFPRGYKEVSSVQ
jgi:hypothetical protein